MLTPMQERFVEEYLIDLDAKRAALRAGYRPATAGNASVNILRRPAVKAAVDAALTARGEKADLDADRVLRELSRVAFFDPRRLVGPDGQPLPLSALDPDTAAALSTLELRVQDGEVAARYRACDKLKALALLARHLGMEPKAPEEESAAGVVLLPEVEELE